MKHIYKTTYFVSTGLLSALMLTSASMYFFKFNMVHGIFQNLGFPTFIIYPLAIAKILGLLAIWHKKSNILKEWAYAGFFFDFILAFFAHINVSDGGYAPALTAFLLLIISYFSDKKIAYREVQ